ncbi:hypothetical protein [Methylogaea oryzae]|uniref:DUF2158 domain-containing protein n=1 Tax=Methylogaea oryzae TaxID=1295382 RepID=A0A8D5AKP8_9GAMM|nr:hypothetical protein [Methylogaea oryzae]BBL72029.1 hypothetical protein MoryE10_26350 [Methylogaea oryzae]
MFVPADAQPRPPAPAHWRHGELVKTDIGRGDVVVAHGSERLMYVYEVLDGRGGSGYLCVWFEGGRLAESVFGGQSLRRASGV